MKIGDQVNVVRHARVVLSGTLVGFYDDSDSVMANVEEFARIKVASGNEFVFRRPDGLRNVTGGWIAKGKRAAREWGYVHIIEAAPRTESERA